MRARNLVSEQSTASLMTSKHENDTYHKSSNLSSEINFDQRDQKIFRVKVILSILILFKFNVNFLILYFSYNCDHKCTQEID